MQKLVMILVASCVLPSSVFSEVHLHDFAGDLDIWSSGPSQIDMVFSVVKPMGKIDSYAYRFPMPRSHEKWNMPPLGRLSSGISGTLNVEDVLSGTHFFLSGELPNDFGYYDDEYTWRAEDRFHWMDFVVAGGFVLGLLSLGSLVMRLFGFIRIYAS